MVILAAGYGTRMRSRIPKVNVNFNDNVTADPDGNEVVSNTINGNLNCEVDSPSPQIGDSGRSLNRVFGRAAGQCSGLAA